MTDEITAAPVKRRPGWALPCIALAVGLLLLGGGIGVLWARYDRLVVGGEAMSHTFAPGNQILIRPVTDGEPRRGDIVMFDKSAWPGERAGVVMVLRVVGVAGDRVSCCDDRGRIQVNGRSVDETYPRYDSPGADSLAIVPFEATVPDGMVFVLGDWRANAVDSRVLFLSGSPNDGAVPVSRLDGRVVARFSILGGAKPIQPPTAFTDAGLTGSSTSDSMPVYAWWATVIGLIVTVLAFVWVVVVGSLRAVRPRS